MVGVLVKRFGARSEDEEGGGVRGGGKWCEEGQGT